MQENRLQVSHLSFLCISSSRCGCELWALNIHSIIVKLYWRELCISKILKWNLFCLIYSCWSCFVFLLIVVFFLTTFFKDFCYVETLKTKLVLNYSHLRFHVLLLLKEIKCLLYYLACNEGVCVMFIKTTPSLCTLCIVAMGSSRMGVSRMKVFYFIKDLH
jgi:hypothetical protein